MSMCPVMHLDAFCRSPQHQRAVVSSQTIYWSLRCAVQLWNVIRLSVDCPKLSAVTAVVWWNTRMNLHLWMVCDVYCCQILCSFANQWLLVLQYLSPARQTHHRQPLFGHSSGRCSRCSLPPQSLDVRAGETFGMGTAIFWRIGTWSFCLKKLMLNWYISLKKDWIGRHPLTNIQNSTQALRH
jgi:hypothetical protein